MAENKKQKRSRILIYCQGDTEKQYLTSIVKTLKITANVSIRKMLASDLLSLLKSAYNDFNWSQVVDKQYPFTEYWLIFDCDRHSSYMNILNLAASIDPKPHLAWSNPCIEFWFWLHYCCNRKMLMFNEIEISNVCTEKELGNDEVEITTVRRVRRSIRPETLVKLLQRYLPEYNKATGPIGLIPRSAMACDNLYKIAQDKNPKLLGSSIPVLLLRLAKLQDEIYSPKAQLNTK